MTELLHCELLEVGGRTYRVLGRSSTANPSHGLEGDEGGGSWRQGTVIDEEDGAMGTDDPAIKQEGDQYVAHIEVDMEILPLIIGAKGATKKRIEQDTGARLLIPRKEAASPSGSGSSSSSSSEVVVQGDSRGGVARARTQVELVIASALGSNRLDYNYFLCLPLATDALRVAMDRFKQQVLAEAGAAAAGIEGSIFMKPAHLHLTLAMLKLYSEDSRQRARQVLHSLAPAVQGILRGEPLTVQLKGLEYMNDDPSQMHVMYLGVRGPPGQEGALQRLRQLCSAVVAAFGREGLLLPQDEREVKLHATVLNTRYRRPAPGAAGQPQQQRDRQQQGQQAQQGRPRIDRQPFDGRLLLEKYGDIDFGLVTLPAVHLGQRGKYGADGFYFCADSLPLGDA
ncbi:hypothetical protein N2152v2_003295 [Parachlorella kessleri]